jgi:hypothetical protein
MLPKVENPIPETIGLTTVVALGAGISMAAFVAATVLGLPETQRDAWGRYGLASGFLIGVAFYLMALVIQLLCRQ